MYFGKLVFESDEQEFSLRGVKSKKISSHPGKDVLKSAFKVRNASVEVEYVPITMKFGVEKYAIVLVQEPLKMKTW